MIDCETAIALAKEAGFDFNKYGLLQADEEREIDADAMFERLCNLAVAHSRKDAEPSFYLSETGNLFATRGYAERAQQGQKLIPLYAHPPEADKLLQQALEALDGALSDDKPYIAECKGSATAIRTYLENKA